MISVDVSRRQGQFLVSAAFESDGGILALFGPSGSGKSSIIRLIAGLDRPDRGRIVLGGVVVADTDQRIFLPAHRRRVGVVFQESLLFPHLTVLANLRYGRHFTPRAERRIAEEPVIDTLGIGHLLQRHPATLSGGERQRVAIGRALLASPRLLLMDEPLASLDWDRRQEILPLIERLRDEFAIPILYVSHAVEEVARLASEVAVMEQGRIVRLGPARQVLHTGIGDSPDRFQITSVLEGRLGEPDKVYGLTPVEHPSGRLWLSGLIGPVGRTVHVVVRGVDVSLATERPRQLSIRTVLAAHIVDLVVTDGPTALAETELKDGTRLMVSLTRQAVDELALAVGRDVFVLIKSVAVDQRPI
jgi:molybdate transport system ATP-binding protein